MLQTTFSILIFFSTTKQNNSSYRVAQQCCLSGCPETPPETPRTAAVKVCGEVSGGSLDDFRWDNIAEPHGTFFFHISKKVTTVCKIGSVRIIGNHRVYTVQESMDFFVICYICLPLYAQFCYKKTFRG